MPQKKLIRVKLALIHADIFTKSELTMFHEALASKGRKPSSLKQGEAVLIRSKSGNQIIIVHNFHRWTDGQGKEHEVLHSRRLRFTDGAQWNELMIADYGEMLGIDFVGLPRLRDLLEKLKKDTGLTDKVVPKKKTSAVKKLAAKVNKSTKKPKLKVLKGGLSDVA